MLSFPKTQALTVVMLTWFVKRILTWLLVMLVLPEVQEKKKLGTFWAMEWCYVFNFIRLHPPKRTGLVLFSEGSLPRNDQPFHGLDFMIYDYSGKTCLYTCMCAFKIP